MPTRVTADPADRKLHSLPHGVDSRLRDANSGDTILISRVSGRSIPLAFATARAERAAEAAFEPGAKRVSARRTPGPPPRQMMLQTTGDDTSHSKHGSTLLPGKASQIGIVSPRFSRTPMPGEWSMDSARRRIERVEALFGAADRHEAMRCDATIQVALMHACIVGQPDDDPRLHVEKLVARVCEDFPDIDDDLRGVIVEAMLASWATQ